MAIIGYIWVGPLEHNLEFQRDLLRQKSVETVYEDTGSGSSSPARPQLTAVLERISERDTLVVWRLDRLGSSLPNVLSLLELLGRRGVGVSSISEGLDSSGDDGKSLLTIVAAFNELERCLIRERTLAGVYAARARGRVGGRPRALSATNMERVLLLREHGASVREIAEELGTSRATVYRALETAAGESPGNPQTDADGRRFPAAGFVPRPGSDGLAFDGG